MQLTELKKWIKIILISYLIMSINSTIVTSNSPSSVELIHSNQNSADLIFYNGYILTVDDDFTVAEAIAIKENKILGIGNSDDIITQYGVLDYTEMIDLNNKAILPGFIDGHTHLFGNARWNGYGVAGGQDLAFRYGFTSVNEKWSDDDLIFKLQQSETNGTLKIRVNLFPSYNSAQIDENDTTMIMNTWFPENDPITDSNKLFRIPGIKIFVDGSFQEARGAWAMSQPMPQVDMDTWLENVTTNPYGNLYLTQNELETVITQAQGKGYQVAFHAMGDRALETVVNAVGNVTSGSNTNYRHQIEHNSYSRPDIVDRFVEVDTVHSVRGYWPTCNQQALVVDNFFAEGYFNRTWYANRYSLPSRGLHVYLETDFSFSHDIGDRVRSTNIDPFLHLFSLVTKSQLEENGTICRPEDWIAKHVISLEQALRIMTIEGAYATFNDEFVGSLEPGKFADLIVVPESPTEIDSDDLKDLYPILTMVNGEKVYEIDGSGLETIVLTSKITSSVSSKTSTESESSSNAGDIRFNSAGLLILTVISLRFSNRKPLNIKYRSF